MDTVLCLLCLLCLLSSSYKSCQRLMIILTSRNLGRDDRIISDHGKESRYPYLDEKVMGFARNMAKSTLCTSAPLPSSSEVLCDLSLPPGVGDKLLLRSAAKLLGLAQSSTLVKRAIQFGTRIANRKQSGSNTFTTQSSNIATKGVPSSSCVSYTNPSL